MIPWSIPGSQSKRHDDRIQPFLHRRPQSVATLYYGRPFPPKLPLPVGYLHPIQHTILWAHSSQQLKRHLDLFYRFCTHMTTECPYILNNGTILLPPSKLPLSIGGSGPRLTYGSLGPRESSTQPESRSVQPVCSAHCCVRPTDRSRHSVGNNGPHMYVVRATRPKNTCLAYQ